MNPALSRGIEDVSSINVDALEALAHGLLNRVVELAWSWLADMNADAFASTCMAVYNFDCRGISLFEFHFDSFNDNARDSQASL